MQPLATDPAPFPLPPAEILEQMERVLASRHFRQTRTLDKFLRHAVTKTLDGNESELKESLIGREVFHRGEDFNPAVDAVVRVQAGMLRKKLASYYAEEGLGDALVIDLPKGCYIPHFQARENVTALVPLESASFDAPHKDIAYEPAPEPMPARTQPPRRRLSNWWISAAAFVIGMALMFGVNRWNRSPVLPASTPEASASLKATPLWEKFLEPGSSTVLAYGTPQFFQYQGLYLRDVMVNSPQELNQDVGTRLASVRKVFKQSFDPVEVYTGVGEAHGIHTLSRFFWKNARELQISRSRLVGWQEVKNSNLIFLSSMRFHTLAEQLNYPNDFVIRSQHISSAIVNLRQAEGELAEYAREANAHYAVITLWPGKTENRRIMQLSGNTTWGTLAAAEYATDETSLRELQNHLEQCRLRQGHAAHSPYFQVLVRAEVKDNQPIALSYVTHHDLEMPGTGREAMRVAAK